MSKKLKMESSDSIKQKIKLIKELFPNVVTEGLVNNELKLGIDFDALKAELSSEILDDKKMVYQMNWPKKKEFKNLVNHPTTKTLRPRLEESKDFYNTKNIFIEGDNLESLKVMRDSYRNKVDMIYIDPPYNTGSDLIYNDSFNQTKEGYHNDSGLKDDNGNFLTTNKKTDGRYHTNWLNFIYPRLKIAKDFLSDIGAIFISIDENEFANLKKVCDEIYGEQNFIENFIWIKNSTKNLSKTTSTNHEYIMCYAKNRSVIEEDVSSFRIEKPGLKEVQGILKIANDHKWTVEVTQEKMKLFYKENPDLKGISSYDRVEYTETFGESSLKLFSLADASAPVSTGEGKKYEILHPKTNRPVKSPTTGWRFNRSKMNELIKKNLIHFYEDEKRVPRFKRYLNTVETEVVKSVFEDNTDGKKELQKLFDGIALFDNAKPTTLIRRFLRMFSNDILVMDFFGGSGTTVDAVIQENIEDNGTRRFILVQLDEQTSEKSVAFKNNYKNIADLSRDRINKVEDKIRSQNNNKNNFDNIDFGYRTFKLDSSNMNDVHYLPRELKQNFIVQTEKNIKEDRSIYDVVFQIILDLGYDLTSKIIEIDNIFYIEDNEIIIVFNPELTDEKIKDLALLKPSYVIYNEEKFTDDQQLINAQQIFINNSIDTKFKVI